jgi:2,4-didehydro-3-deoxy-L-rhamnonate hydrolase
VRLLRIGPAGEERPAVLVDDDPALDLSGHVDDIDGDFLADDGVTRVEALLASGDELPRVDLADVRIGAPVARPHQVLCIGLNYEDHAAEAGMALPEEPVLFTKSPNTVVGPYDDIELPRGGDRTDWEAELAIVIGRRSRYLDDHGAAEAAIAGYCVANDVSERSFQLERGGQWSKGKSCATFNPLGPWLVTPDEVGSVGDLAIGLDLDGEAMQDGSTKSMVFPPAEIVRYLSQFLVLEPGDVINTGTPAGVGMGMDPPRYLRAGDVVEPWIEGLGRQRCTVVEAR